MRFFARLARTLLGAIVAAGFAAPAVLAASFTAESAAARCQMLGFVNQAELQECSAIAQRDAAEFKTYLLNAKGADGRDLAAISARLDRCESAGLIATEFATCQAAALAGQAELDAFFAAKNESAAAAFEAQNPNNFNWSLIPKADDIAGNRDLGELFVSGDFELWDIPRYLVYLIELMIFLAGSVAVAFIIWGGYQYIIGGATDDQESGKKTILYSLSGLAVTVLAYAVVNIVQVWVTGGSNQFVHYRVGEWGEWGACQSGTQIRERTVEGYFTEVEPTESEKVRPESRESRACQVKYRCLEWQEDAGQVCSAGASFGQQACLRSEKVEAAAPAAGESSCNLTKVAAAFQAAGGDIIEAAQALAGQCSLASLQGLAGGDSAADEDGLYDTPNPIRSASCSFTCSEYSAASEASLCQLGGKEYTATCTAVTPQLYSGPLASAFPTRAAALASKKTAACKQTWGSDSQSSLQNWDSKFRSNPDGLGFKNYIGLGITKESAVKIFGKAKVCNGDNCLTPSAAKWLEENEVQHGVCFGMASFSAFRFDEQGAASTFSLKKTDYEETIGIYQVSQTFEPISSKVDDAWSSSASQVMKKLKSRLPSEPVVVSIYSTERRGAHAIVGYKLEQKSQNEYTLYVYDNNYPDKEQKIELNTAQKTWIYDFAAVNPGATPYIWSGKLDDETFGVTPASELENAMENTVCPFCHR